MRRTLAAALAASALGGMVATPAPAADSVATRDSFRIGSDGVSCSAQFNALDKRLGTMFDRAYALTCRDAAAPVGAALVLRRAIALPVVMAGQECAPEASAVVAGIGAVRMIRCHDRAASLDYLRYGIDRGAKHYVVEGLAGYDSALRLALASLVNDRPQPGTVRVATTEVSDLAAFASIQAGALDTGSARIEGYLRNNGGRYAESAEFFDSIAERQGNDAVLKAETWANQGLQQSNLGNAAAARGLFDKAQALISPSDPVLMRLLRNYRAIAELNRQQPSDALVRLAEPMPEVVRDDDRDALGRGLINEPVSLELNSDSADARRLRALDSALTPAERSDVLDGQALALTGTAHRQLKRYAEAERELAEAGRRIRGVREGTIESASWMLSDIAQEQALLAEDRGDGMGARARYDEAIAILEKSLPDSPALLSARARKASMLGRLGDRAGARALFRDVVAQASSVPDGGSTLRGLLEPYLAMLADAPDAAAAGEAFAAAQARQRPGVAQTQAVLARQFSEGSDEASALFRLSLARTREIARAQQEVADLQARPQPTAAVLQSVAAAQSNLAALRAEQTGLQARLSAFPRYQALSRSQVDLTELQQRLKPGEAYWQLIDTASRDYALFVTPTSARLYRTGSDRAGLADDVRALRDTIARTDQGQVVTDPFDVARSAALFTRLMGPIAPALGQVSHLIVEPDGALLQLPVSVLVSDPATLAAYQARQRLPGADEYDYRGIAWLGRGREISTAVSARSFLDVRAIAASKAHRLYLGLGDNAVPGALPVAAVTDECEWPLSAWQAPISPAELKLGERRFGPGRSELITGAAFSDTALLSDRELGDFRVLHFATHGLVTAPRPDCPPRPALLTSFGGAGSDGLLSFKEIFDLHLDADVVILSACDTAGLATIAASREAGVTSGGNYALDGLVRAFVGAGARSVVASHWPVPDDYGATGRLMGGLLGAKPGEPLAAALRDAQAGLMDDPKTSHPFYWAAFIILGDGAKPLLPAGSLPPQQVASLPERRR
ncbi:MULTISPECIES: CHAT domain-containing protein [Sphingomonas]|uniref:CHAT domain-containing protein n=1 Tax=Sphingomonas TaxID=13687 RepID=UPI000DEF99A2|nr:MULTISPECIES: CHAT domain-containing protein [Sphingomonas]